MMPAVAAVLAVLTACASELQMQPAAVTTVQSEPASLSLLVDVTGVSSGGYPRTLRSGTRWLRIGSIHQGEIL